MPSISAVSRPPGPKGTVFLGNLPQLGSDILGLFSTCAREYGDIAYLSLAGWPAFVLSNPEHIEQVLVTEHKNFIKHTFFWRHVRAIFGNGLLTSEGDFWMRQRRLAQPSFHRDRIAGYGDVMVRYTERTLDEWRDGEVRDLHQDLMRLTLLIVAKVLFDADVAGEVTTIGSALDDATHEIRTRFRRPFRIPDAVPIPGNLRYRSAVRRLDSVVDRIIEEHRARDGRGDLLSMLMQARDDDGQPMTDAQLRDEAITIMLAGHETTAIALAWTCLLLSQHPAVAENLHEEIREVLGDRPPTMSDLPRLRLADMVVSESLRLYPPAYALGREAVNDCTIGEYSVPAGASVFMSPYVVHRDARWFDEPERFLPERWAGNAAQRLPRFAYFPFGGGPRICIGNRFAIMEAVLLLTCMVRRFRFKLHDPDSVAFFPTITLRPANGMRMTVSRR
jgi:cytochrome P450